LAPKGLIYTVREIIQAKLQGYDEDAIRLEEIVNGSFAAKHGVCRPRVERRPHRKIAWVEG